jgi:hypothetical protein
VGDGSRTERRERLLVMKVFERGAGFVLYEYPDDHFVMVR